MVEAGALRKFFSYKSVRYKNFFVYLRIEKYGYAKRPLNTYFLVSSWLQKQGRSRYYETNKKL